MAAEAQAAPAWLRERSFASAWIASWRALGGIISINARGQRCLWFPYSAADERRVPPENALGLTFACDRERRSVRRALLAMLDAAGAEAKDAVFAIAAKEG